MLVKNNIPSCLPSCIELNANFIYILHCVPDDIQEHQQADNQPAAFYPLTGHGNNAFYIIRKIYGRWLAPKKLTELHEYFVKSFLFLQVKSNQNALLVNTIVASIDALLCRYSQFT